MIETDDMDDKGQQKIRATVDGKRVLIEIGDVASVWLNVEQAVRLASMIVSRAAEVPA